MKHLIALFFLSLGLTVSCSATGPNPQAKESREPGIRAEAHSQDLKSMQADVLRMRAILNQMRTNLGFVANTTTPVHHQFELEIDMWQVLLDQMERRIAQMQAQGDK